MMKPPRIRIFLAPPSMSVDQDLEVSSDPSAVSHVEPHHPSRKVSIVDGSQGHDNLAFDPPRSRKVSANSEHAEIGPVRKKDEVMLCVGSNESVFTDSSKHANGDVSRSKKHSVTDSVHSKTRFSDVEEEETRSWWYTFCLKCRSTDEGLPPWQPDFWPRVCPHPFCPSYRQVTRIISLALIGILSWCVLYAIVGETAAPPDGRLFQLIVLSIGAYCGGWLISLTTLPALVGMLFTGLLFQNLNIVNIDKSFASITKELRNTALVILLIRAGLDLDPTALRRLKFTVMKIGLIPWTAEAIVIAVLSVYLLHIPWEYGLLAASIGAAVSPAVVVPCLFRLRSKGYGVAKGIPTLIIAIAGIDDAVSVAIFGIVSVSGLCGGLICYYAPERNDPFMVPLRVILLLVGGMISLFGSELIGYGGAGPLGVVTVAFVCLVCWNKQGWDIEDNPAATAFQIFWMIFEPILFGITGATVKINELDGSIVGTTIGILAAAAVLRIIVTVVVGIGCKLNLKEKIFVAFSLMAKATVQAALGPVALSMVAADTPESEYAEKVLQICILSILLTAPTAAILMILSGPKLLTKTKFPLEQEGWKRSHRPSIRDISIIDEEEERDENLEASLDTNHKISSDSNSKSFQDV
ncbi:hypothetical protein NQ317_008113 [Molorchus minor]|uniref:Cation/H+ exchanger transmembrane domain-containing protein n=1 Tax=Molorchus minor TaxID=1323400 RepID=A0ABQ9K2R6_9CUCU|nr:hypothetical protein NQ317_008113 [Molorchus minor]